MSASVLFELIVTIILAVVSTVIVPMVKQNIQTNRRQEIVQMIDIFVAAAEQTMKTASGAQKKEQVMCWLTEQGVDADQFEAAIEAAVYELRKIAE